MSSESKSNCPTGLEEIWRKLEKEKQDLEASGVTIQRLFEEDSGRAEEFAIKYKDLLFDYSKNLLPKSTRGLLLELIQAAQVESFRDRMFSGERLNVTEDRPVLHVALRNRSNSPILVENSDVMPKVNGVLAQMKGFVERVRSGEWKGYAGH